MMIGRAIGNAWRRATGAPTFEKKYGIWSGYIRDAVQLAGGFDCTIADIAESQQRPLLLNHDSGKRACHWYLPPFDHPFYGGLMTIFRVAAHLHADGIDQRFIVCGNADRNYIQRQIGQAFRSLGQSEVIILDSERAIAAIPPADYSIASLWTTAYTLLRIRNTAFKFYLIQDFEPSFYPAGSTAAQAEATYRFGFLGICNTRTIAQIYMDEYGGTAHTLVPQIDPAIFYPPPSEPSGSPTRIFWYARPATPRNGFELAAGAFRKVKGAFGDAVDIICAGSDWDPRDFGLKGIVRSVGRLQYAETADLYRTCRIGLLMSMTRHPSYLPLELMACGCLPVVNMNPATGWLLEHERNCLVSPASVSAIAETLARAVKDYDTLKHVRRQSILDARARSSWSGELAAVSQFIQSPPLAM